MITETELETAETRLTEARAALAELEAKNLPPTQGNGAVLAAGKARVELAENALRDLLTAYQAEQADLAARPEREKAAAEQIKTAGDELAASRARVAQAATAAQAALVELLDPAGAHNLLITQTAGELAAKGLTVVEGLDHQTAGAVRSGKPALRVKGQWWPSVDVGSLAAWVVHRVTLARLGRMHALTGHLFMFGQRYFLANRVDQLLDEVPAVATLDVDPAPLRTAEFRHHAPTGMHPWQREAAAAQRARDEKPVSFDVKAALSNMDGGR